MSRTEFTVRVHNSGGSTQTATGSFAGGGDFGGAGSGQTMLTFERTSGPTAIVTDALSVPPIPGPLEEARQIAGAHEIARTTLKGRATTSL